jgi:2,3-bisphosphoglycerate-dependent phosphoglycerate mutase
MGAALFFCYDQIKVILPMALLAIVRHGLSQANIDGIVAGHLDTPLTEVGRSQAKQAAELLRDISFDVAHVSSLERARHTLDEIIATLELEIPTQPHDDLKERFWGEVESTNKEDRQEKYTEEERASWSLWGVRPPGGESYEDMSARVVGYFDQHVLPQLKSGQNVLLVGHNGMLKTLQRHLEDLPHEQTYTLEMGNCDVKVYEIDPEGRVLSVHCRSIHGDNPEVRTY